MELKHIKELMLIMGRTGTKRLELEQEGVKLTLDRGEQREGALPYESKEILQQPYHFFPHPWVNVPQTQSVERVETTTRAAPPIETPAEDLVSTYITSFMIGTYYEGPGPGQPPFVKVGDKVEKDVTVVAIIEAMKVMNEIKANASGTIVEVLVESGHPVEFGTKLFRLVD